MGEITNTMLSKKRRPGVSDLRPIALTEVSYKVMMRVLKDKIESHIKENGMKLDEQAGFTEGGDIVVNLLILQECVRQTYRAGRQLVVVAVDFSKAFDSVRREKLVEVLQD